MPTANPEPAVQAGAMYFVHDRLADPGLMVTAQGPVPGFPQIWVVRDSRGHEFVCRTDHLASKPLDTCFASPRRLLQ